MPRENSPLIVGDFWLDKRRDGLSPDIWQVATYSGKSRSVVYRSTKRRTVDLEAAKAFLRAYEAQSRSKQQGQDAATAELLPHLFNYIRERGPDIRRLDTIKSSYRAWIGFLMQDELGTGCTVADITPGVIDRFRRWRMGPHEWSVEWNGKTFKNASEGVSGHAVQRNIEDLRAALNYAEGERRIEAPKVPSVPKKHIKKQQKNALTTGQLGALLGYAREDKGVYRELCLMLATSCRPGVAMAFDPNDPRQWDGQTIDLQPEGREETDKRNAIVPAIAPIVPILEAWMADPHERVASRKTWWRTAKRVLSMPGVEAYDIRHTVTTYMDAQGVPGAQMSGIAGHLPSSRGVARTTSAHYLHYDPLKADRAKAVLTKLFVAVMREADRWAADQARTKPIRGKPIVLAPNARIS